MSCILYNGQKYSNDEFANLLLNGELEILSLEKKVDTPITEMGKEIESAVRKINAKFDRKMEMEKAKYEKALKSSPDLIKLRNFLKKDLIKNSKLSDTETRKQAGLTGIESANELKNRLAIINNAWRTTKTRLESEKQLEINIAQEKPVKAKDVFSLRRILKNAFGLRKIFKTKAGTKISQDEAAATLMDKVLETIAKRQNVTKQVIYNSTFYKRSRMEEINNSLETLLQAIGPKGISNLAIPNSKVYVNVDGKKRSEISDSNATFKFDDLFSTTRLDDLVKKLQAGTTLSSLIYHDALYKAYPELAFLKVQSQPLDKNEYRGYFTTQGDSVYSKNAKIVLNSNDVKGELSFDIQDMMSTLLHEIQHAIQLIEGFEQGLDTVTYKKVVEKDIASTSKLISLMETAYEKQSSILAITKDIDELNELDWSRAEYDVNKIITESDIKKAEQHLIKSSQLTYQDYMEMYMNTLEEIEARATEYRQMLTQEELDEFSNRLEYETDLSKRTKTSDPKIFKNYEDAIFYVVDRKPSILFQESSLREGQKNIGFNYDTDVVARERFDLTKLKQIGKGSDRTVFDLGNGKVLKVANTARGLEQNIYEGDGMLAGDILPNMFERGLNYVVVDNIPRAKSSDSISTYNLETADENGKSTIKQMLSELSKFSQKDFDNNNYNLQDVLRKYGFDDVRSYNIIYGDFTALRNWGYKNGSAYHIDGGTFGGIQVLTSYAGKKNLEDKDFRDIYNKSKQLKKEFGDTDKYTMFQQAQAAYQSSGAYSQGDAKFGILEEGEDIIHAVTSPNVSSPLHEAAHKFEKYLTQEEKQVVLDFADSIEWTMKTSETFARGFEKFLSEGNAPSPELQSIFEAFASWLMAIYNGIIGSDIDIELNDEMRKIYSAMLGSEFISQETKEVIPTPAEEVKVEEQVIPVEEKTVEQLEKEVADLRAEEKVEYAAMTDQTDEVKKAEIFAKYDVLITPILRDITKKKSETVENIQEEPIVEEEPFVLPQDAVFVDSTHVVDENFSTMQMSLGVRALYTDRVFNNEDPLDVLNDIFGRGDVIAEPVMDGTFIYYLKEEADSPTFKNVSEVSKDAIKEMIRQDKATKTNSVSISKIDNGLKISLGNAEYFAQFDEDTTFTWRLFLDESMSIPYAENDIFPDEASIKEFFSKDILQPTSAPEITVEDLKEEVVVDNTVKISTLKNSMDSTIKIVVNGNFILYGAYDKGFTNRWALALDEAHFKPYAEEKLFWNKQDIIDYLKTESSIKEESMVEEPVAEEEFVEEEVVPVRSVNGYSIGDRVNINGSPHKIRSFIKIGDSYYVQASSIIFSPTNSKGTDTNRTTSYKIDDVSDFVQPTFKNSTLKADVQETDYVPKAKDIVSFKNKQWRVNSVKPGGSLTLKSINKADEYSILEIENIGWYVVDKDNDSVIEEPFDTQEEAQVELTKLQSTKPYYEFANSSEVTAVKIHEANVTKLSKDVLPKEQALKNILNRLQDMFPTIKYKIVDYPDQKWSGRFNKGVVEINFSMANTSDAIHEYLHPFVFALKSSNRELYDNVVKEMKKDFKEFYTDNLKEIKSIKEYSSLTKEQQDDEILIRILTDKFAQVIDSETGLIDEKKKDEVIEKNYPFLRQMFDAILDSIKNFISSFRQTVERKNARTFDKIAGIEYNPVKGSLKFLDNSGKEWVVATIGKPGSEFKYNDFVIKSRARAKQITDAQLKSILEDIDKDLKSQTFETNEKVSLDFKAYPSFNEFKDSTDSFKNYYTEATGEVDSDIVLKTFSLTTTIDELSAWLINNQTYKLNMDKHSEAFEEMSDLYAIKNKTELEVFTNSFRSKLKNLEHTIEKRLRGTKLTPEVKERIVSNLTDLKTLTAGLNEENSVETTVNILRVGFTALQKAEGMMQNIRTRINYGDINNYINALVINLTKAGVKIEFKDENRYGIRLNKGVVEINKQQLIEDGWVPMDIGKYMVGDYKKKGTFEKTKFNDEQEAFRKKVQGVNTSTINNLKVVLSPAEIEELNWDISMLRNFYATYDSFTNSLLKQYAEHFEYSTEYIPYSQSIADAVTRHKELEQDMRKLAVEWLFPYFDKLQIETLKNVSDTVRTEKYVDKDSFAKLLRNAAKDNNKIDFLFGALVNTEDPINATVAILLSDVINRNTNALGHLVSTTKRMREDYFKSKGITTSKARAEYIKNNFLRKAKVYEAERDTYGKIIVNEKTNEPIFKLTERWAFNTEYNMDEYEIARKDFMEKLAKPIPPPMGSTNLEWTEYQELAVERTDKIKEWEKNNKEKFKNKDFERLMKDEMYRFLYTNYESSNNLFGEAKLKYGIVQQGLLQEEFIEKNKSRIQNLKSIFGRVKDKNTPAWSKTKGMLKTGFNYLVGQERDMMQQQENPDGTTYKSIKTSYLRMQKDDNLDFDLTHTITGFTEDALRYNSLRGLQANVENLRLLTNGTKNIDGRKVPQLDANGSIIWHSMLGKPKSKDQYENHLNKQLNYFIDRVFYGEKQKQVDITLWKSRKYQENLTLLKKMVADKKTPEEIYQATTFYMDDDNRWKTDEYANLNLNLNNLANKFTFWTSVNSLAMNVMSTTRNLTIGNFVNLSEGNGNKYYNKKQYAEAAIIYGKNIPQNAMDLANNTKSKLNQVLFDYQAIQGEFRDRYNRLTSDKSAISRLFSTDTLFFLQHVAEHQIQGTATLALLLNTNVKLKDGTTTNLWDALTLDKNGVISKDNIDPSSFDETKFIRDLHEMNRSNHGNYSDLHKTAIQREWYGGLLMTFRKHMYPTLKARFGKQKLDYSKGVVVEGFHRTFFKKIIEDVIEYGANITAYDIFSKDKQSKGWTNEEEYSFKRATFETLYGVIGMMLLTLLLSAGDDDDDDSAAKKWLIAAANGLYTDIAVTNPLGIYNPFVNQSELYQEVKKIGTNPVAVQFTFKKIADFMSAVVEGKDAEVIQTKFEKIVPVYRHLEAFSDPEAYVDGYLQYQSLVGTGLKKGAK